MAMSKDRVEFTLKGYYFEPRGIRRLENGIQLLMQSFGVDRETSATIANLALRNESIRVRCRPSQFARFLINREQAGFQNMFKELEAKIITSVEINEPIDLSRNGAFFAKSMP